MKKNGFTLIELLAVITILGILITIGVSATINSRQASESKLTSMEKKGFQDAGMMLAIDLNDEESDIYNCSKSWVTCTKSSGVWTTARVSVENLIRYGYIDDDASRCSGTIRVNNNEKYTVTLLNFKCGK